jgi:hypothetical protein
MQTENEDSQASEPKSDYNMNIVFFKSFEKMNVYDHQEMASHTPVQRLQNITGMIMKMYENELKHPMTELTIHFK